MKGQTVPLKTEGLLEERLFAHAKGRGTRKGQRRSNYQEISTKYF